MSARTFFSNSGVPSYSIDPNLGSGDDGMPMCYDNTLGTITTNSAGKVGVMTEVNLTFADLGSLDFPVTTASVSVTLMDTGVKHVTAHIDSPTPTALAANADFVAATLPFGMPFGRTVGGGGTYCGVVVMFDGTIKYTCPVTIDAGTLTVECPSTMISPATITLNGFTINYLTA